MTRPHSVANIQLALGAPEPALARIANWTLCLLVLGMLAAAAIRIVANFWRWPGLSPCNAVRSPFERLPRIPKHRVPHHSRELPGVGVLPAGMV